MATRREPFAIGRLINNQHQLKYLLQKYPHLQEQAIPNNTGNALSSQKLEFVRVRIHYSGSLTRDPQIARRASNFASSERGQQHARADQTILRAPFPKTAQTDPNLAAQPVL